MFALPESTRQWIPALRRVRVTDELSASLASGPHGLVAGLIGDWAGTTQTWFMPGELADTSETTGTVRSIMDGRFVVHEYRGSLAGEAMEGQATLGFHIAENRFVCAWVDSAHNGTADTLSDGRPGETEAISVLGSYDGGEGLPWGWRTTFAQPSPDELVISHFNIPPGGDEYLGVETRYRRVD
jgi:hypothetical protein